MGLRFSLCSLEDAASWYDFNTRTRVHNRHFFASNAVPLYTRCYAELGVRNVERFYRKRASRRARAPTGRNCLAFRENAPRGRVVSARARVAVMRHAACLLACSKSGRGVPTSMRLLPEHLRQQWDRPNLWPNLQSMIIEGLRASGSPAYVLARAQRATPRARGARSLQAAGEGARDGDALDQRQSGRVQVRASTRRALLLAEHAVRTEEMRWASGGGVTRRSFRASLREFPRCTRDH